MPLGISAGTASLIGAGVSAAGGVASSLIQSGNAGKAGAQTQRNLQLILPQMQQSYVQTEAGYQPYTQAGQQGLTATNDLLGLNGSDAATAAMARYQTSPGYQWQLSEGLRGVDAGAASHGILRSGATIKGEEKYAEGLANQDFTNYYNRLYNLSGQGLTAAQGIGAANQNLISQEEGNATSQNAAITNQANAQNSATGNLFSGLGNTANNLLNNNAFLQMIGAGGSGSGSNPFPSGNVSGTQNNTGLIPSGGFAPAGSNTWYW